MAKSTDLKSKIRFVLEVDAAAGTAQIQQTIDGVKTLNMNIENSGNIVNEAAQSQGFYNSGIRGTLMSLRMFSFAVRTLRREFGDTNPVIEGFSTVLITVSSGLTGLVAGGDLVNRAMKMLKDVTIAGLITSAKALATTIVGLSSVLIPLGIAIATIGLAVIVADWQSGLRGFRQEAKLLAQDLKLLEVRLEALNREQEKFSLTLSATSLQMMILKRAIDLQQSGTEALQAELESVTAEYENMRIAESYLNLETQRGTLIKKQQTDAIEENARRQKAIGMERASRGFLTEEDAMTALQMVGWKKGDPRPTRQMFAAAREQNRAGLGAGGGMTNVNINFPDAVFQTVEGLRQAIVEGATEAARIIQFNQYAEPGKQR